ncbi:hypothetical protein BBI01_04400 [Chryseobacterium artocarpi]|uniref:Uncharacterized protein n=1 Tax=Chryseobacterium artocarpi TaxID=1414727 RepID=A0A1B8ZWL5_9FLAO|nr:hypothetical protein [Chryseobacterium artocarpi]OCA75944.1 hypothetical protein BBI01_04400 [Chryseobacterium artocarpi]
MKRSIILMSFLTLFSCSENDPLENENSEKLVALDVSNTINSIDPLLPYQSPYGNNMYMPNSNPYASPVEYVFINETDYGMTIYPMIGLAYYDGIYDNKNFGWNLSLSQTPYLFSNSQEYLKIATCKSLYFAPHSYESTVGPIQLPTSGQTILPSKQFFDAPVLTTHEKGVLFEGGKFYGMEVGVGIPYDPNFPVTGMAGGWLKFRFLPDNVRDPRQVSQDWQPMPTNNISSNKDYWYNTKTREICPGNNPVLGQGNIFSTVPSERKFSYKGKDYELKAYTTATQVIVSLKQI